MQRESCIVQGDSAQKNVVHARLYASACAQRTSSYKKAAVIFADQLNQLHFCRDLEIIESTVWFARAARQDYAVALNLTGSSVDDPDATLVESYACDSEYNFTRYCNPEVAKLLELQFAERDVAKRRELIWEIERILNEDVTRPVILHGRTAECRQSYVKRHVRAASSISATGGTSRFGSTVSSRSSYWVTGSHEGVRSAQESDAFRLTEKIANIADRSGSRLMNPA